MKVYVEVLLTLPSVFLQLVLLSVEKCMLSVSTRIIDQMVNPLDKHY